MLCSSVPAFCTTLWVVCALISSAVTLIALISLRDEDCNGWRYGPDTYDKPFPEGIDHYDDCYDAGVLLGIVLKMSSTAMSLARRKAHQTPERFICVTDASNVAFTWML